MSALTLDQLRAYLERHAREADRLASRALRAGTPSDYLTLVAIGIAYREMLEAIEKDELPE